MPVTKQWSAAGQNTRDTHAELDGTVIGVDEPFVSSSGAEMMYPGEAGAPAAEVVNCRCVLVPGVGEEEEKSLKNNDFYDIINEDNTWSTEAQKGGKTQMPRYPVTQELIDDILKNELAKVEFPVHPIYNPALKDDGLTTATKTRFGPIKVTKIEIGMQSRSSRAYLIDTLYHEYLEAKIFEGSNMDSKYKKLNRMSDHDRHEWIYKEIDKFFKKNNITRW